MSGKATTRMTSQRRVILDCLTRSTSHPTAYEVYRMVKRKLPEISLATVYRNLDVLSAGGLVQRMDYAGAQMRFDADTSAHCHARCLECGRVVDVDLKIAMPTKDVCCEACGFKISAHRVELLGLCPACASRTSGGSTANGGSNRP